MSGIHHKETTIPTMTDVGAFNRNYINELRGASILRVVMVHLGLSWFYLPYSSYIGALLPLLFFVSGAVSYFSFIRSASIFNFAYKRLMSILVPYYLLVAIISVACLLIPSWELSAPINWLLIAPDTEHLPFELGQVWFLQSLALITIITLPIYWLSKKSRLYLMVFSGFSLSLICLNSFYNIHSHLAFGKVDLYLAVSNAFFFTCGCLYFLYEKKLQKSWFAIIALIFLLTGLMLNGLTDDFSLGRHMESPDIIYTLCACGLVALLLFFKTNLQSILDKLVPVKHLLLYASKHAYSIYLLHTLVLGFIEHTLFPQALTSQFGLAIVKMLVVVVLSLMLAPAYSFISNLILKVIGQSRRC